MKNAVCLTFVLCNVTNRMWRQESACDPNQVATVQDMGVDKGIRRPNLFRSLRRGEAEDRQGAKAVRLLRTRFRKVASNRRLEAAGKNKNTNIDVVVSVRAGWKRCNVCDDRRPAQIPVDGSRGCR